MNSKLVAAFLAGIVAALLLGVLFMSGMMRRGGMMQNQGSIELTLLTLAGKNPALKVEPLASMG